MKRVRIFNVLLFVLVVLPGCKNENYSLPGIENYNLEKNKEGFINDIFEDVELVPLRFEKETYPNSIITLDISDSIILLRDRNQLVHLFDSKGNYISCSKSKYGNGPGEYDILMGTFIGKIADEIVFLTPFRMIVYDRYFNVIRESHLPTKIGDNALLYNHGYNLGDNKYLLLPSPTSDDPLRIDGYDSEKEQIINSTQYSTDLTVFAGMQSQCFFCLPDSLLLFCSPAFSNYTYQIVEDRIIPYMSFTFSPEIITQQRLEGISKNEEELFDFIAECKEDFPANRLINSFLIIHTIKRGLNMRNFYSIITNRHTSESLRINLHDGTSYGFPFLQRVDEIYAYTIWPKNLILSNPTLLLDRKESAEELLKDIDLEDYVLLKYKFRK